MSVTDQPLDKLEWVERDRLFSNSYNPNKVFKPELELLKLSILADGWTQPLVGRFLEDGTIEIVDGFHRWTLSADPEVRALTDGFVPVVPISTDPANQRASTIRHNRARGEHGVVPMAEIVRELVDDHGKTLPQIEALLGMDDEEAERLYQRGGMVERGSAGEFSNGWVPQR